MSRPLSDTPILINKMAIVLGVLLAVVAYAVYKIYQFVMADADLNLLKYSLKPDFFKDKVVWVTGASSGIGEELCKQLSPLGAKLILSARSKDKLESICQQLSCPENGKVVVIDMLDRDRLLEFVQQANDVYGRIDILVNNAGVFNSCGLLDFEEKPARMLFDLNFFKHHFIDQRCSQNNVGTKRWRTYSKRCICVRKGRWYMAPLLWSLKGSTSFYDGFDKD